MTISATIEPLTNEEIKIKYPAEIAEKFIQKANEIDVLTKEYDSDKFAINIRQNLYITKKKEEADFSIRISKHSKNQGNIIKELKDPADTHKYTFNNIIIAVNERLKKKNISFGYKKGFNSYVLNLFINFYNIKENPVYSYCHLIGKSEQYTYSQQLCDFIIKEISKNPSHFVESLKTK